MSHNIIDRRKNDTGKSSVNRRKFIERFKGVVKDSVRDLVRDTNIKDLASGGGKKIKIPARNMEEPHFRHDGSGSNSIVRPGNEKYVPGDRIKRPPKGGPGSPGSKGSEDGDGEDSFSFHLTKDEFLDLFFDNCELPDLVKQSLALVDQEIIQRAGFTNEGAPSSMNIMRSMRGAKGRRSGLRALKNKKLKTLLVQEADLILEISIRQANNQDFSLEQDKLKKVQEEIEVIKKRIKAIPFIDPIDLKYNNWDRIKQPTMQAVIVCVMDVSGSMYERHKELAKTFYLLLYLFLMKNYDHIAIEYIQYHSRAKRVDENEFYYGRESGGTVTSTGLELAYETIMEDYPPASWNIYLAHASDGDNFGRDNILVEDIIINKLLPILQYYAYIQINPDEDSDWRPSPKADPDNLWNVMGKIAETKPNMDAAMINSEPDVYPVFIKLFERK